MENILSGLNEQQKCAVTCPSHVLQVLAPPGSGKTKTLTARVAYHIAHQGLKPWNMIVCTFTIKAAREMKERIRTFVGDELERKLVLGTFHSVARRYLSTYGHHIGVPKHFGIADSNDTLAMIKRIVKKNKFEMEPAKARSRISKRKSGVPTTASGQRQPGGKIDIEQQEFEAIFTAYEQELKNAKLLDYDDLLLRCVELLTQFPECVSNIEAVLIDEFQDTNHVQYELMNLFAQHRAPESDGRLPSITIVGDPDQSIYSFRSAEIENLMRMKRKYADTHVVHLEENYRSSGSILRFAIEVIEQDTARPQKNLQATHSIGQAPVLRTLPTASAEAAWLVSEIQRSLHLNAGLLTYSDYAVLLRSASLSRLIETELGRAGIPYRMVGGHKFFDRVEVRILLDYLRVVSQPDHNDALLRVLNVPSRKLGDTTVKALLEECEVRRKSLWQIIKGVVRGNLRTTTKLSQQATSGIVSFANIIFTAHQKLVLPETSISDLLAHVMQKTKYESFLKDTYKQEYEDRAANVDELVLLAQSGRVFAEQEEELIELDGVQQATTDSSATSETLAQFLANIALATDSDKQDAEAMNEKVVISTIHAAKGLEWPVVFIPAAYEGSIPHSRAEDVDEERRLLYVGMTRAKALLYLSWPKKGTKTEYTTLSPFLSTPTMARYYHNRGPSFGWQVSSELASILKRSCPSSQAIDERYKSIGRDHSTCVSAEDSRYPDNGEEFNENNLLLRDTYTAKELDESYGNQTRKRKFDHGSYGPNYVQPSNSTANGFISAKHVVVHAKPMTSRHERLNATEPIARNMPAPVQPRKKLASSQSSIKTFFSTPSSQASQATFPSNTLLRNALTLAPNAPIMRSETLHKTTAPINVSVSLPGVSRNISRSFQRPHFDSEHEATSSSYILLSSSPPRAEDVNDVAHNVRRKAEDVEAEKENSQEHMVDAQEQDSGIGKSTIWHQTSMQKLSSLQSRPGARMTIGSRAVPGRVVNTKFRPPTIR